MFAIVPVFVTDASVNQIINTDHIEHIAPASDVTIGETTYSTVLITFFSGSTKTVLLDFATISDRLQAVSGIISDYGQLT